MKNQKKNPTMLLIFLACIWIIYISFNTDRFIRKNIRAIDSTETITIVAGQNQQTYEFDEKMIDLLSYGGTIFETDNLFERLSKPYYKELDEMDLSIIYRKNNDTLGTAKVYQSSEEPDEYILYLNNIYWVTSNSLDDLLDVIENKKE